MAKIFESAATLRIMGDNLHPEDITRSLGREPDRAEKKGDRNPLKNGRDRIAKTGSWERTIERKRPGNLDEQIAGLLTGLTENLSVWTALSSKFEVQIFCGLFLREYNEGLYISAETTKMLGSRGIALDFSIYDSSD